MIADLRIAAQQALEAMRCAVPTGKITLYEWDKAMADLDAALAQQVKHVAWMRPWPPVRAQQAEQAWVCPESPEHRYTKPGYCKDCGKTLVQQAEPDHETRAELAEQQVVQLAEERDHYRNLWQKAQQAEPVEPVAWMFELARNFNLEGYGGWEKRITEYRPNTPEGSVRNVTPLSPQRKPLTDEEIAAEWQKASECASKSEAAVTTSQFVQMFARAIERAHGIGEGA